MKTKKEILNKAYQFGFNSINDSDLCTLLCCDSLEAYYTTDSYHIHTEAQRRRKLKDKVKITRSADCIPLLTFMAGLQHEEFHIIALNRRNVVISVFQLSKGGTAGTVVDPKIIFKKALELGASALILAHNHPSGETIPSEADNQITNKIVNAGKLLEISILDHVIIGENNTFFSYADEGRI